VPPRPPASPKRQNRLPADDADFKMRLFRRSENVPPRRSRMRQNRRTACSPRPPRRKAPCPRAGMGVGWRLGGAANWH
jgi:hypothetical protein